MDGMLESRVCNPDSMGDIEFRMLRYIVNEEEPYGM